MLSFKKNLFLVLLLIACVKTSFAFYSNNNFYVYGTYEETGVTIQYNAIIESTISEQNRNLILQLNTFNIEQATYKNKSYRNNDIFGISFPVDTAVELKADIQLLNGNKLINNTVTLNTIAPTILNVNTSNNTNLKLQIAKTISIKAIFKHEIFISKIKEHILLNTSNKNNEELNNEYTRLIILGNNYLSENNFTQAKATYVEAKKYANTVQTKNIDSQIAVTNRFFEKETNTTPLSKNIQKVIPKKETQPTYSTTVKKEVPKKELKLAKKIKTEKSKIVTTAVLPKKNKKTDNAENVKKVILIKKEKIKPVKTKTTLPKKIIGKTIEKPPIKTIPVTIKKNTVEENKESLTKTSIKKTVTNYLSITKGFIKYKRDEQSVEDGKGNTLIPYGKYKILRYKAGFAHIKLKDSVAIKNIVCTNTNEEYVWSARIYENPWLQTVIDTKGNYVKELEKKVEIYIVDNINYRPFEELSKELIKSHEDPNPFKGSQQISAFNLWNRNNATKPWVIQKRKEIEKTKQLSKEVAYKGIDKCRNEVSKHFEEVYNYYLKMGYEIILKK